MSLTIFDLQATTLLLMALIIGSFIGVVIRRVPAGQPLVWSRSRCEHCGAVLAARDLLPLISWGALLGCCRHCHQRLGWFYPAVEIAALLIAVIALAVDGVPAAWLDCLLGWWLLALGWIDSRNGILPDVLTLPLIVAGLVAAALFDPGTLVARALGAVFGYLALRGLATAYRLVRRRDGLGQGDAKLMSASGGWLGLTAVPDVIFVAALGGVLAAGASRLAGIRLKGDSALPFGPFLAIVTWLLWMFGPLSWS